VTFEPGLTDSVSSGKTEKAVRRANAQRPRPRKRHARVTSTPRQNRKPRVMCASGDGIIAGEAAHGKAAFTIDCGQWACDECAPRMAKRLRARTIAAKPTKFFSLTIRHRPDRTLEQETELLKEAWRKFRLWWARQPRGCHIECGTFWELKGERHVHIHALARCGFVPRKVLRGWFARHYKSQEQDVREVKSAAQLAHYVTKYVTKDLVKLARTHRYSFTHGFEDKTATWERDPFFEGMAFAFENNKLPGFAHHWFSRGWSVDLQMERGRCLVRPPWEKQRPCIGGPS